jgi:hypothetical protein
MAEVPLPPATASWQKSSISGGEGGACVHVACGREYVWIRDSKDPGGPVLGFTREEWATFLVGVRHNAPEHSAVPA